MLNECEQFPDENSTLETEAGFVVGEKSPYHSLTPVMAVWAVNGC
jgi:hypothetical protein